MNNYRVKETKNFKRVYLIDTEYNMMVMIYSKDDPDMDRIKIVTLGSAKMNTKPEEIIIYRYQDRDFIENIERSYKIA